VFYNMLYVLCKLHILYILYMLYTYFKGRKF